MKKLLFIVSFLVLFCTSVFAQTVGQVTGQMGTTWNERDGQTQNTTMGYALEMNDFLQTGEDGGMILSYVDDTKFTMGPNTELIIDEFAFDITKVPIIVAMNVSINVGTFTYESGKVSTLGGEVNINAGNATITVQGTAISGTVTASGEATITLLPDSNGVVGQVTVSNDAGSQTITNAYNSVTVLSNDLAPTPPKIETNKSDIIELKEFEKEIKDESKKSLGDVDKKSELSKAESEAQEMEEAIISEEANIVENSDTIVATDMSISESDLMIETKSAEETALDTAIVDEVDTSYYDSWEEDLKDWGYIDEDNQISVWDAEGEKTMDWDDAKKMYAEMDQAYFDAIGCSDCTWDTINWDEIDWDAVDWDAYYDEYNDLLEDYGLTSWNTDVNEQDVVEDVADETEAVVEGYTWEDFDLSDDYYNNNEYKNAGGPPTLTIQNYCEYNGYDSSWCTQDYVDYLNDWYGNDWTLKVTNDSWSTESKNIFGELYGWCGSWPNWEMCDNQPKPWKMKDLKAKYISDWEWADWQTYWDALYDWWYTGYDYNNETDESNWEDEYDFEDDYAIDAELELLLASYDEEDCLNYGYYWDNANSSCGTEWVDNSGSETQVTASGETLNYVTGDVTQTLTTTSGGVSTSTTSTGRVSTLSNEFDADVDTSVSGYSIINRYNDSHRAYLKIETADEADIQILQDQEAQHFDIGSSSSQENITIIQTD